MTLKEAKNIGAAYFSKYKSVAITSDGSVFLNSDIESLKKYAKKKGLELFITKEDGTK